MENGALKCFDDLRFRTLFSQERMTFFQACRYVVSIITNKETNRSDYLGRRRVLGIRAG